MGYNMMTCSGFSSKVMGGCSIAWLVLGILVILTMIVNRQLNDFGYEFNQWGGYAGVVVPYFIIVALTGNIKIALIVGLVGLFAGGLLVAQIWGGDY